MSTKYCKYCGQPFEPNSNRQQYCKRPHYRSCPVCGKTYLEDNVENLKRPPVACSYECRKILRTQTSLQRYGITAPGNNPQARERAKETMQRRYGVDYALESITIREKARKSLLHKYGVANAMQDPATIQKAKHSVAIHYGQFPQKYISDKFLRNPVKISKQNQQFQSMLASFNINSELEFQVENRFYDICIPESKILIELDSSAVHNCICTPWSDSGLDKYYHRDKTQLAESHGFRCIHIFDWDNWESIISLVLPTKSIYARDCQIYHLRPNVAVDFLNKYHIQGSCRGQDIYLGLVKDGELYMVMTFGRSRYNKQYSVELLRMATKHGYRVVGGASKLFQYFVNTYEMYSIISYCDRAKFSGNTYTKMGMKLLRTTPPQEVWSRGHEKITANLLRQRGYDQLFGTTYGKGSDNNLLMLENGWLPVYDCGQKVFILDESCIPHVS